MRSAWKRKGASEHWATTGSARRRQPDRSTGLTDQTGQTGQTGRGDKSNVALWCPGKETNTQNDRETNAQRDRDLTSGGALAGRSGHGNYAINHARKQTHLHQSQEIIHGYEYARAKLHKAGRVVETAPKTKKLVN